MLEHVDKDGKVKYVHVLFIHLDQFYVKSTNIITEIHKNRYM